MLFEQLIQKANDEDVTDMVYETIRSAADYIYAVSNHEIARLETHKDNYRSLVNTADEVRHNRHEEFMHNVNMLNSICDNVGCERIYTGSKERREYGDFAFTIVRNLFEERI